jgi:hypothetical protein
VWIDRLWLLLAVTLFGGIVLAFFNTTTTVLPDGGVRHTWSTPQAIQYMLVAIYVPLAALAIVGALYVAQSEARAFSLPRDAARAWATGARLRKIGISLAIALAAAAVSWSLGGSLTSSSNEGYSNVWPFVFNMIAAIVFFTALASAWTAARAPPDNR